MEKDEEETREILLPNWQGSGSMGITLENNEEGVFVKQLVQDSPAAQTGVVKEGDQIVGATVYFDQMSSDEVKHLLSSMGHHTVGLKLQRKGDRSPLPGMTWSQEAFSLKSPDVVLSGDDEDYKRIFTKKIKPRLKSEDLADMEHVETQSRTITVTRKVTAYTVDVTGSEGAGDADNGSPEFKIKFPRQDFTERSRMEFETPQGKTVIRTANLSGESLERKDLSRDMQTAQSGITVSGPTEFTHRIVDFGVTEKDLKEAKPDVTVSGFQSHMTTSSRLVSDGKTVQMDISPPEVTTTEMHFPGIDASQANAKSVQIEVPGMNISGAKFQSSTVVGGSGTQSFNVVGISKFSKFGTERQIQSPEITMNPKTGMQVPTVSISRRLIEGAGTDVSLPNIRSDVKVQSNKQVLGGINPSEVKLSFPGTTSDDTVCGVDLNVEGYGGKLQEPHFGIKQSGVVGGKVKVPNVDVRQIKQGVSISAAKVDGGIAASGGALTGPDVKEQQFDFKGSETKLSMPKYGFRGPQVESSNIKVKTTKEDVNISASRVDEEMVTSAIGITDPKIQGSIYGPKVDIAGSGVAISPSKVDVKVPTIAAPELNADMRGVEQTIKMPTLTMPRFGFSDPKVEDSNGKLPQKELDVSSPSVQVNIKPPTVDSSSTNLSGINTNRVDIQVPGVDLSVPNINVDTSKGTISMPKFKMPKFGFSGLQGEVQNLQVNASVPKTRIEAPDICTEGKIKAAKFKKPSMYLPQVSSPDIDLQVKGLECKGDADISSSTLEGHLKGPKVGLKGLEIKLEAPEVDIQLPKGNGKLITEISGPKLKGGTRVFVEAPELALQAPSPDIHGPEVNLKDPKFKMPKMNVNLPTMSMPGVDLNLKGPKWKGGSEGPEVEVGSPNIDIEVPEGKGKFKMPKFALPKFSMSGPKLEGPEIDVNLPKGNIDFSGPKMDIDAPEIDIEGPKGKVKGGKFNMPSMELPKVKMPDMDFHMKGPKWKGGADISGPKIEGDLKGPNINVEAPDLSLKAPDLDIEGPDLKMKDPKFKMPSMDLPKMSMPDLDLNIKGPNWKGGADLSGPSIDVNVPGAKVEGGVREPKLDIGIPKLDLEVPEAKTKKHKFRFPKFNFSGSKAQTPSIDVKSPKMDIDVSGPKIDLSAPDVDIQGPEGKIKSPKLKMPSLNISSPKVSVPDVELNLKGPKLKGDVDLSGPTLEGDLKIQKVDIKCPALEVGMPDLDVDSTGAKTKVKLPKFSMPKFKISGLKSEESELDVKLPKGDIDVARPKVDIEAPEIDVKGLDGNLKGGKFKLPSMNANLTKVSVPDIDLNIKGPKLKGDVDMSGPKLEGDFKGPNLEIKGPEIDIDGLDVGTEALDGKVKGPKFIMPPMHMPNVSVPAFDLNLKGPKYKGDVDISGPKLEGDLTGPKVDIEGPKIDVHAPDMDIEGPEGKVKGPKFKIPSLYMPKVSMPDFDLNLKGPNWKGEDVDISGPKLEGDFKGPALDAKLPEGEFNITGPKLDVDASGMDIEGPEGKVKLPKFKMPSMEYNLPKVSMPDFDLKGPSWKGGMDISGPNIEGPDVKVPDINVEMPGIDIKGPEGQIKMPKFKIPKLKSPEMEGNASVPHGDVDLSGKIGRDFKGPKLDMDISIPDAKIKGGKLGMTGLDVELKKPNIDFSGPKLTSPKVDLSAPSLELDVETPETGLEGMEGNVKIPKVKKGMFGFGMKTPKPDIISPSIEANASEGELNIGSPDVNIGGEVKKGKFKMPKLHMSGPKIKGKKGGFDVSAPGADADVNLKSPDFDVDIGGPEGPLKGDLGFKAQKTKKPLFGKIHFPDVEFDIKSSKFKSEGSLASPKIEGEITSPEFDLSSQNMKADIKSPGIDLSASGSGSVPDVSMEIPDIKLKKSKFKLPTFSMSGTKGSIDVPSSKMKADLKVPSANVSLDAPNIKGPDVKLSGPRIEIPSVNVSVPKISMPDTDLNLKGPTAVGDLDISKKLKDPHVGLDAPTVSIQGSGGKFQMPKLGIKGPTLPDLDGSAQVKFPTSDIVVSGPKIRGGMGVPDLDVNVEASDLNIKGSAGNIEGSTLHAPTLVLSGPRLSASDPKLKGPKIKGDLNLSGNIQGPALAADVSDDATLKGFEGMFKMPEIDLSGPKVKGTDFDPHLVLPKGDINLSEPKIQGSIGLPNLKSNVEAPDINLSGPKLKGDFDVDSGHEVSKMEVCLPTLRMSSDKGQIKIPEDELPRLGLPGAKIKGHVDNNQALQNEMLSVNMSTKGHNLREPMLKGGLSGRFKAPVLDIAAPSVNISGDTQIKGPTVEYQDSPVPQSSDVKLPKVTGGFQIFGPKVTSELKSLNVGAQSRGTVPQGNLESPSGKVTFPKLKMPKFTSSGPELSGREVGVDVNFPKPEVNIQAGKVDADLEEQDAKLKKSKIKMPKFNFSRQKGKGDISVESPEASITLSDSKGELKSSKASLGSTEGGLEETNVSADLQGAALSPKAKSSTFDFSLFRSKKPRHRSSSLSDERDLSPPTTPSGMLEAKGGTASIEREKGKSKHSKLKFGTFGGLGSKTKGSYEVTFSDEDTGNIEGSGVSLASKKSRISSSSSNDSGTKGGVRLPNIELTVAKKKE